MFGLGVFAGIRRDARHKLRGHGSSQMPGEPHRSSMSAPSVQADPGVDDVGREAATPAAQHERRGASGGYLGYLLCTAGRQDLLTTRHLHDRLPPEMPPMC